MQPILNIRPIRTDRFTYSLGAARQSGRPCEDLFETIDSCLHDAGEALATYFERVQIFYAGIAMGTHPVARLLHDPLGLLQELKRRLVAILRVRSARWAPPPPGSRAALAREKAVERRTVESELLATT